MDYSIVKSAEFSECGLYRYQLQRSWSLIQQPTAMCIGLNPSTANSDKDDPTIRTLISVLKRLGYGGLLMCNLYALISSKPDKLWCVADNVKDNDKWLVDSWTESNDVIFCWGSFKGIDYRVKKVSAMFPDAKCFGLNKNGTPMHPLSLMYQGITKTVQLEKYHGIRS